MLERWKWIRGYEGAYEVSDAGRVRSWLVNGPRILRGGLAGKGYRSFVLCGRKPYETRYLHHLVAEAFIGPAPIVDVDVVVEVNHIDGNKLNSVWTNLEYTTSSGNKFHALRTGIRTNYGERHPNAKMSDFEFACARALLSCGWSQAKVGHAFGVSQRGIGLRMQHWKHVKHYAAAPQS